MSRVVKAAQVDEEARSTAKLEACAEVDNEE